MRKLICLTVMFFFAAGIYVFASGDLKTLEAAVRDIMSECGDAYPRGGEFFRKLQALENGSRADFGKLQREALLANPLVNGSPIVFVVRRQYRPDHHNTATIFQHGEINAKSYDPPGIIKSVDFANGGIVRTIVDGGPTAVARDPDVSFDGRKILFSMRKSMGDDYHIYEVNIDGSELRQLTSAPGVSDIDPIYLPDGSIVFSSTREPKYCMCNRHIMCNLFKMEGDGANIHQIGRDTLFEGHSSLMPDGRILYDRWEYVDRNFGDAQGLWTVNPDGTGHAIYWGNNTASPGGVIDGRIIPGTQYSICIFGACHDRPWGALAIIDRRKGVDGRDAVIRTWPAESIDKVDKGGFDSYNALKIKYEDPYPLSDKYFLVSRMTGVGEQMGIYLIDVFGNEVLLHVEESGCFDPMPLASRSMPPVKPLLRNYEDKNGIFYIQDVYVGTHMKGVERGSIKSLRIIESPPKMNWTSAGWGGQGTEAPAMNWLNFENKRILGTVPVEEDGSAHFECPSDKFVFFQALDENGMMVQSMRSGTVIQSGETQGCVGCHENRVQNTPVVSKQSLALKRAPSKLNGWYGEPRLFSFQKEVQPVFDKHCVECHDFGKSAGKKLNLAGDRDLVFSASYYDLWSLGFIKCVGAGPAEIQEAKSWGSHPSKLVDVICGEHKKVKMSPEEVDRIITWVDINAPYYPSYDSAYSDNMGGRAPLDGKQLNKLQELTGCKFHNGAGGGKRAQVSFDRPELSPCLEKLTEDSKEYRESLSIIKAGAEQMKKVARGDIVEGFAPCTTDQQRNQRYSFRKEVEAKVRAAIQNGRKLYDADFDYTGVYRSF